MDSIKIDNLIREIESYDYFSQIDIEKIVRVNDGYAYITAEFLINTPIRNYQLMSFLRSLRKISFYNESWNKIKVDFYLFKSRFKYYFWPYTEFRGFYRVIVESMKLVDVCDNEIRNKKNFENFLYFFECIVVYHKFLGG